VRILITGHQGYIGRVMTGVLRADGNPCTGIDAGWFAGCTLGWPSSAIPSIRKDIRDLERADLKGFDAVVHLAAICNDPLGDVNPEITFEVNYSASLRLAELAREEGVQRFLFSSSCSIYGGSGEDLLDESAPVQPLTAYARSKVLLERGLAELASDTFCPVYLRNATAYGLSPGLRLDLVLNDLVASAHLDGRILIKSDGTPWRPIVHVRDICGAFVAALRAPAERVWNQAFNVGSTRENYRIRDLAEIVAELVPNCAIEYASGGGPDKRCYRVKCDKIRAAMPEFDTHWNARRGVEELHKGYRELGLSRAAVPQFSRLRRIRQLMSEGSLDSNLRAAANLRPQTQTAGVVA
jgi:nucleoside-diphosphate-sugar epimerase